MSKLITESRIYRLTGLTPILGSAPASRAIRTQYIASKAPTDELRAEEEANPFDSDEKGVTVFNRNRQDQLCLMGYQMIVDMYRTNQIGSRSDKWPRHLVDGEWITLEEAARRVNVPPHTLRNWIWANRDAEGNRPTLAEAMAHYRQYQTGEKLRYKGKPPRRYYVYGKQITIDEAAAKYGTTANALRQYIRKHACSLQSAVRAVEARKKQQAEKEILAIIYGEGGSQ